MSRVPAYPFRCIVTRKLRDLSGIACQTIEQHNYATLAGAWDYRNIMLARSDTYKVEIIMVIDESTPTHHRNETQAIRSFRAPHSV